MKKIFILFICLFTCIQANAKQLRFAQVSDVNYSVQPGANSAQILDWTIRSINKERPEFVVFLGNNIKKSNQENLTGFLTAVKEIKAPYYVVTGNQDSHKISGIKKTEYWNLVRKYNKNNKSKNTYYTFSPNSDVLCVVMDGGVPFSQSLHGIYPEEQIVWLDKILTKNKNKAVLIFQHFPIIEPYENKRKNTLYKEKYLEVLKKHNNVAIVSSGHYDSAITITDENGIYHISTPSLNKGDFVYDIVTFNYKKLPFSKVKIKEIEVSQIDLQ